MQQIDRVLHIVGVMNRGGQESFIMNVYRNIDKSKVQFDFVVHSEKRGDFDDEIESLGGYIYRVPAKTEGIFKYFSGMNSIFNSNIKYRNVHIHTCSATVFIDALLCKINYRGNIIIHSHNNYINEKKGRYLHYCLRPILNQLATFKLACSSEAASWGFGKHNVNQVKVIKNGIELKKYAFDSEIRVKYRKFLNLKDEIVIGHIGRFDIQKNHVFLINLFKELFSGNPNYRLVLVGTGELENEMKKLVFELGLSEVVFFLGSRDDVHYLLQAMDIFLFPSLFEGLGIAAIESQASGLPTVIASNLPDDLNLTTSIYRVSLADGIESWCQMINLLEKKRYDNQTQLIEAGFDITDTINELYQIYLTLK